MNGRIAGWGNYPVMIGEKVQPATPTECHLLARRPYQAFGQGRSYGDACLPAISHSSLQTENLNRLIDWDEDHRLLTAESGIQLRDILKVFLPRGYFLPVVPGTQFVSLGGAVASNIHGKNHHRHGSFENIVERLLVLTERGPIECSREMEPELFHATFGAYGLTGLILEVSVRLKRMQSSMMKLESHSAASLDELIQLFEEPSLDHEYSVAWIDALARGPKMGRGILLLGEHADPGAEDQSGEDLRFSQKTRLGVPLEAPSWILNKHFLSLFNETYYRLQSRPSQSRLVNYDPYFFPLDFILNWNKLYGKHGFFQYQCVIPDPHGPEGIRACLEFLSRHGLGSFLAVLKRCGDDHGIIPFCKIGYTLALDIPFRSESVLQHLHRLDELVMRFGGRIYLSKDARVDPENFRSMYPEYENWRAAVERWNPERRAWSRMAERLKL